MPLTSWSNRRGILISFDPDGPIDPVSRISVTHEAQVSVTYVRGVASTVILDQVLPGVWVLDADNTLTVVDSGSSRLILSHSATNSMKLSQHVCVAGGRAGLDMNLPLTAFGDLRVAELSPIFQSTFEYTVNNTDITTNTVVNGGSVTQANGMAVLATSSTIASTATLQSKRHAKYKAGLGGVIRFTALFTPGVAGTKQYMGLVDETGVTEVFKNGYMVGFDGEVFGFHRFQNDTKITMALENWDDTLDGFGQSGILFDPTKLNVFFIQYQYLGAGAIKIFMEKTNGELALVHTDKYAGLNTEPSTHNPNFHHIMFVDNGATTNNLIVKSSSYAYFTEGKTDFIELHQPQNSTGEVAVTGVTSEVAIFTIRNKTTYVGKINFIDALLERFGASIEASAANNLGTIRLTKNATLGGVPSYSDINTTNSIMEIDTSGTTVTEGKLLSGSPLAGKNDKLFVDIINLKIILGPGDSLTVSGDSVSSASIRASILWRELF